MRIGIIGGGFTGTMTAVQLIEQCKSPCAITIVDEHEALCRGIAYNPYSERHILNVAAGKMSAFPERPDHFLDWAMTLPQYKEQDRTLIANAFLPRRLYGDYLCSIWDGAKKLAAEKGIEVSVIDGAVADLDVGRDGVTWTLNDGAMTKMHVCVIASGNQLPRNPPIGNTDFYNSPRYYRSPWSRASVLGLEGDRPVLIVGNGLTMVDTVLGLLEQGFTGEIHSISPNGFNVLPHRHGGLKYTKIAEELREGMSLHELVRLVKRHVKAVRAFGVSAEPVIDALRPHTQRIWRSLSPSEKRLFMARLRHLWGVARHRVPVHTHDLLQQLRIDGKLHIRTGRIIDIAQIGDTVRVEYFDKKGQMTGSISVSRVINCTGPETNLEKLGQGFLKNGLVKGLLTQDPLKLGIAADPDSYRAMKSDGTLHTRLFTLGPNLKGELWESTAVNELRDQARHLAQGLLAQGAK